jgi:hypothetical protein
MSFSQFRGFLHSSMASPVLLGSVWCELVDSGTPTDLTRGGRCNPVCTPTANHGRWREDGNPHMCHTRTRASRRASRGACTGARAHAYLCACKQVGRNRARTEGSVRVTCQLACSPASALSSEQTK